VSAAQPASKPGGAEHPDVTALIPILRRVVGARVSDAAAAEDLVQETLARVLAAAERVQPGMLEPYAISTARNLVVARWKEQDRHRRNQHRILDLRSPDAPDEAIMRQEEKDALSRALAQLSDQDRHTLLAHEISGQDTRSLAQEVGSTAGALAARLSRIRARLRVEYLLALEPSGPVSDTCRSVLLALSSADRRRQGDVEADRHLLECEQCARLSRPLLERGRVREDEVRIHVSVDHDVVQARQGARELAARLGFSRTELTVIATAVSEIARNIVKFAGEGEIHVELVQQPRRGVRIVARDTGPGIPDVPQALADGYSTYHGLGLGLPGARRLMDEFDIVSETGRGTTVTMTKWRRPEG
jgi:serine/threonine-protein kinase RsbT